ncbi:MAG: dihydroorotase [Oscillospiraceae bacterium]|nr:dihydroorotase [Oscillospiraceae bacterium]
MKDVLQIWQFLPDTFAAAKPDINYLSSLLNGVSFDNISVFPGFCDVHVHFREPGFSYKETIRSGSEAAAAGGYTAVCAMPNLSPVPDSEINLKAETDIIKRDAVIKVYPYAAITVGQKGERLSDMEALSKNCIAFSDDGKGVQSAEMMEQAMINAKKLGRIIAAHCEVNDLLNGGYIHKGIYAEKHGHKGICSESEWKQIERDIALSKKTGCAYHVCHISCKESVELIRQAKRDGVDITCETAPHYLLLDENDIIEDGRFKMNPPLRSKEDKAALIEGVSDGTVDMIATDHAPHSAEEKSKGLKDSAFGIVGIETAFQLLYTGLVKTNIITIQRLIEMLSVNPRKRFGIPINNDYTVWDMTEKSTVNPENFLSMGKSTPFEGREIYGKCLLTVEGGKTVYKAKEI